MSQFNNMPSYGAGDLGGEPNTWPKVIGIISIVWASLGMICNGCGAVSPLFQSFAMNMVPPEQQAQMQQQAAAQNPAFTVAMSLIGICLSLLLLFAGIQTLRYRWKGRMLHLVWGGVSLLAAIVGAIFGFGQMKTQLAAQIQQMQSDPNMAGQAQQMQGVVESTAYGMYGCMVFLSIVYPLFTLIWFGLIKTRQEQMGTPPQELVA